MTDGEGLEVDNKSDDNDEDSERLATIITIAWVLLGLIPFIVGGGGGGCGASSIGGWDDVEDDGRGCACNWNRILNVKDCNINLDGNCGDCNKQTHFFLESG